MKPARNWFRDQFRRWAALVLALGTATAATASIQAGGYLKDIYEYSASPDGRPYFLNTARARLSLDGSASILRSHVDYDQEVLAGSFFRTQEYQAFGLGEPNTWLGAEEAISTDATTIWRQRLYRGWLGVEKNGLLARFGRQRIAWGTGKLWNPTDVLNPYQPLSVERDERRGVDALYARAALGDLSQAELAWAPQDVWAGHALLARLKSHAAEYDVSLMGGKVAASSGSWIAGGDFAGNFFDGTLHGEWSYTDLKTRTPYWRADLGYDYVFPTETRFAPLRDANVVAEYYHSGSGQLDPARYDFSRLLTGQEVTLAQDYLGLTYSKDLVPLLKLELVLLQNLDDGSQFFSPDAQWNALPNFYLTAGLQRFGGPRRTEFGRPANLAFLQTQYYF